jgi:hypothetical protein
MTGITKKAASAKAKGNGTQQFSAPNQWTHILKPLIWSGWMMEKMKVKKVTVKTVKTSYKEMASLYPVFLQRHLRPKITEFRRYVSICVT